MFDRISKYELKRVLGKGTTGTVYHARDSFSNDEVALKVLDPVLFKDAANGSNGRGANIRAGRHDRPLMADSGPSTREVNGAAPTAKAYFSSSEKFPVSILIKENKFPDRFLVC